MNWPGVLSAARRGIRNRRQLVVVWFLGLLFLVFPEKCLISMGLSDTRRMYKGRVWGVTSVAFTLWVVEFWPSVTRRIRKRRSEEQVNMQTHTLTSEERFYLSWCVAQDSRQIFLLPDDPAATTLCKKGLLDGGSKGPQGHNIHMIPDSVWKYLRSWRSPVDGETAKRDSRYADFTAEQTRLATPVKWVKP